MATTHNRRIRRSTLPAPSPRKALPEGFVFSDDLDPTSQAWLWDRLIPAGALTLVAGAPGASKSSLLIDLAARITKGTLDGDFEGQRLNVLYLSREDSVTSSLIPKLTAAGAWGKRRSPADGHVILPDPIRTGNLAFPKDNAKLQQLVQEHDIRVVVLDSLMSFMETKRSLHGNYQAAVEAATPLAEVCARIGVTVIGVMHLRKDADTASLNQIIGSVGISATARHILMVGNAPMADAKVVGVVKSNLGPEYVGMLYNVGWTKVAVDATGRDIFGSKIEITRPATEEEVHSMLEKQPRTPISEQQNLTVLGTLADGQPRTRAEIEEALGDQLDVLSRQFQRILGRLLGQGLIKDQRTGKAGAYTVTYTITARGKQLAKSFAPEEDTTPPPVSRKRRPVTQIDPDEEEG